MCIYTYNTFVWAQTYMYRSIFHNYYIHLVSVISKAKLLYYFHSCCLFSLIPCIIFIVTIVTLLQASGLIASFMDLLIVS